MTSFLEFEVVVRRAEFTLELSLSVRQGETVAVLGPNGAGKSTLLGVLAGLLRPDSGRVVLDGRVLTDTASGVQLPAHRRGVGLLAQQALLFPHLTAQANVAFGPRCAGVGRAASGRLANRWLADVDVAELAGRRPGQLSGGQAQRVALARALAGEPKLLLLDEPLAALDVDSAPALRALLRRVVKGAGRTAVLVTHDVLDALVLADRVVVLTGGSIAEQGPTRSVLTRPRSPFAARIAGLNLVPGVAAPGGLRTDDGNTLVGMIVDPVPMGERCVAVFPPSSVAVFVQRPVGSPRNVVPVRLAGMEPRGEVVRLRAAPVPGGPRWPDGLAADVTPGAVADLAELPTDPGGSGTSVSDSGVSGSGALALGATLWFAVKATEVLVHRAAS
ncbi:MAG TPA: ATP-binding cassette domain-containing protein [Pseudonocardia sp.]|jgi:molybdate transport system ATP-binding protein